jgi:hypothetical protein
MTCTCGHTMTEDAPNREAAVEMFRAGMTQEALDDHMRQYHQPGEPKPTLEQAHAMIGQVVAAAA